jgi:ribosomal protein S18 acetylase RimI-like enzyme
MMWLGPRLLSVVLGVGLAANHVVSFNMNFGWRVTFAPSRNQWATQREITAESMVFSRDLSLNLFFAEEAADVPTKKKFTLKVSSGDEGAMYTAGKFMVEAFWLEYPFHIFQPTGDGQITISDSAKVELIAAQAEDLSDKFGERIGKRLLNSCLITSIDEDTNAIMGVVCVEVRMLDTSAKEILTAQKSELNLKNALASLGPKQRRQFKDSTVSELTMELLPSEVSAVCVLSNLSVSSKARRTGLGAELCCEVERIFKDVWGFDHLFLKVEADNVAAKGLYEKMGFRTDFKIDDASALRLDTNTGSFVECTADTLVMTKNLKRGSI